MTGIYWGEKTRLKTYSAVTRDTGKSVIKIELVIEDAYELASLIRQLDETKVDQAPAPARQTKAIAKPTLLLEDRRSGR